MFHLKKQFLFYYKTKSKKYQYKLLRMVDFVQKMVYNQIAVEAHNYTTGNIVVTGDSNLIGSNIKSGVTIFGVNGTYIPPTASFKETKYFVTRKTTASVYFDMSMSLTVNPKEWIFSAVGSGGSNPSTPYDIIAITAKKANGTISVLNVCAINHSDSSWSLPVRGTEDLRNSMSVSIRSLGSAQLNPSGYVVRVSSSYSKAVFSSSNSLYGYLWYLE